jgi:carbonyl reductase 1
MSRAPTPTQAAAPVIDLALRSELDPAMYGELIRYGQVLPWRP